MDLWDSCNTDVSSVIFLYITHVNMYISHLKKFAVDGIYRLYNSYKVQHFYHVGCEAFVKNGSQ